MRGMRERRRGRGCLVRGVKGGVSVLSDGGDEGGRVRAGCVVGNVECGAGAVEGRIEGLGEGGSRDVVRRGKSEAGSWSVFCCSRSWGSDSRCCCWSPGPS
jgi:hypothetical protein